MNPRETDLDMKSGIWMEKQAQLFVVEWGVKETLL